MDLNVTTILVWQKPWCDDQKSTRVYSRSALLVVGSQHLVELFLKRHISFQLILIFRLQGLRIHVGSSLFGVSYPFERAARETKFLGDNNSRWELETKILRFMPYCPVKGLRDFFGKDRKWELAYRIQG